MTNLPIDEVRLRERLIQLTRDLVLVESTDARPDERKRCFQLVRNHLEQVPGICLRMLEKNGYESLLALPRGCGQPKVLFCAHLDVVEHPTPEAYRSVVSDGRIVGPGAGDMKGQLAILIELMRHLWKHHPELPVGLAVTSDEERGGENGVRFLVEEAGVTCGVAVIPDGGSITDITLEEKGIAHLRLSCVGTSAHAARPWLGANALRHLAAAIARVLDHFDRLRPPLIDPDELDTHWHSTCEVTMMDAFNDSPNRIPDRAEAVLDVRFIPPETLTSIMSAIQRLSGPGVAVECIVGAEPSHLAPDPRWIDITRSITGAEPRLVRACGGSDGRFFAARGIPVILSRPRVGNLHGPDEWIEVESMLSYFQIAARYAIVS
ncbi:MAG: M20/M25/M40 family metallo-hydrolase [Verrucomicrobiales bacterium]